MASERVFHTFGPVYDKDSKILILGSFPSVVSRQQNFYYANRSNRFWPLLADLFEEEITDRKQFCLDHHIALWDVIESCRIDGSSDASIRDVKANDIGSLVEKTAIRTVFTTGQKAADLYRKYVQCDIEHIALPSTSGANAAMSFAKLKERYQIILEKLYEEA